jgi:hypothetical protein
MADLRDIMAVVASSAAAMLRFNFSSLVRLHLCLIASAILLIAQQSSAKTLNVGGALGWTDFDTAISAAPNYEKWSSTNSINVGDVLGQLYSVIIIIIIIIIISELLIPYTKLSIA